MQESEESDKEVKIMHVYPRLASPPPLRRGMNCVPSVDKSLKGGEKMANRAYKFRIYPTEEQKLLFARTFVCVRLVYNYYLEQKIKLYQKEKRIFPIQNVPVT